MNSVIIGAIVRGTPTLFSFAFASICLLSASSANACPYDETAAAAEPAETARVDEIAATHAASSAVLVGANCAYSTGLMARRVIAEGRDWTYVGGLRSSANDLPSRVAAPYRTLGGDPAGYVVATEILETLVGSGHAGATLSLSGRSMEVDGTTYVVLTSFRVINA